VGDPNGILSKDEEPPTAATELLDYSTTKKKNDRPWIVFTAGGMGTDRRRLPPESAICHRMPNNR
jgi:hypothetical protein